MSRLHLVRAHRLSHAEARARVARLATRLSEKFGADTRWDGDDLVVEHSSLTGRVSVRPAEIVVDGRLGLALGLFRAKAEEEIGRLLDRELAG
jgi:putative polyhydroxyalkanoate system protein